MQSEIETEWPCSMQVSYWSLNEETNPWPLGLKESCKIASNHFSFSGHQRKKMTEGWLIVASDHRDGFIHHSADFTSLYNIIEDKDGDITHDEWR